MAFTVPDGPAPGPPIPPALVPLIEESVKRFEKQLRAELGVFAAATNLGKWLVNYRAEVARVALMGWQLREADRGPMLRCGHLASDRCDCENT